MQLHWEKSELLKGGGLSYPAEVMQDLLLIQLPNLAEAFTSFSGLTTYIDTHEGSGKCLNAI